MSTIKHFTDLEVWQRSHLLFLDTLNIAEGFNRSKAKFLSALDIALGESNETENWLYKIWDANFLGTEEANARIEQAKVISRLLIALIHSLENKPNLPRYDGQLSTVNRKLLFTALHGRPSAVRANTIVRSSRFGVRG